MARKREHSLVLAPGAFGFNGGGGIALGASISAPFAQTAAILGAGGLDYALYDAATMDRMWQEARGQSATNPNQPVGLIVGREKQQAKTFTQMMDAQPEKLSNPGGPFVSLAGVTVFNGATSALVSGAIEITGNVANGFPGISINTSGLIAGRLYEVKARGRRGTSTSGIIIRPNEPVTEVALSTSSQSDLDGVLRFVATAASTGLIAVINSAAGSGSGGTVFVSSWSIKEVPAHYANQITNADRPTLTNGQLDFSLSATANLLTDWTAQAGANCIIAQISVPAVISAIQTFTGAQTSDRFRFEIGTNGVLAAALGPTGYAAASGGDLRNQQVIVGLSWDGAVARLFENAIMSDERAQVGTMPTTMPFALGAVNVNSARAQYFNGQAKRLAFGKTALTLAQFQTIRNEWLATA